MRCVEVTAFLAVLTRATGRRSDRSLVGQSGIPVPVSGMGPVLLRQGLEESASETVDAAGDEDDRVTRRGSRLPHRRRAPTGASLRRGGSSGLAATPGHRLCSSQLHLTRHRRSLPCSGSLGPESLCIGGATTQREVTRRSPGCQRLATDGSMEPARAERPSGPRVNPATSLGIRVRGAGQRVPQGLAWHSFATSERPEA